MAKHKVIAGAAAYVDADGMERWAREGDEVELSKPEADRLMALGALEDPAAVKAAADAEEKAYKDQLAAEQLARDTEAERLAGEEKARVAAAKKS